MVSSDVIIAGAGPAGSIAAHRLASQGVKVTLLDRYAFPRDKSCGDGVGARGLDVLDRTGLDEWAKGFLAPEILRMSSPDGQVLDVLSDKQDYCFGRVIPRLQLDAKLVQKAVAAGAQLQEKTPVESVDFDEKAIVVRSNGSSYTASILILADGSHAPVTRKLGFITRQPDLYAIRQYYHGDADPNKRIEFHFQPWVIPGYTWIFPMSGGHANVGTGTLTNLLKNKQVDLKQYLNRFIQEQCTAGMRLAGSEAESAIKGQPLRTELGRSRMHASRIMVVGDAAGLVNPLSGEGISSGMESGEIAARHALKALQGGNYASEEFARYTTEILNCFLPDWRAARLLRHAIKMPRLLNHVFRKMRQDNQRALLFTHVLLNDIPQRKLLNPLFLMKFLA